MTTKQEMTVLLLLTFIALLATVQCAPKELESIIKGDLPYIRCDVCEHFAEAVVTELKQLRQTALHGKIDEITVAEVMDAACKPANTTGEWIRRVHVVPVQKDGKTFLALEEPGGVSKCGAECLTVAQSCEDLLEHDLDADDLSAYLWKRKTYSTKEVQKKVCKEMSSRCKAKALPASYQHKDLPFVAMEDKDLEMEKMMESMKAMGMGGSLYNRDDMMNMQGMGGGMDGDEDEDYEGEGMGGMGGMSGDFGL